MASPDIEQKNPPVYTRRGFIGVASAVGGAFVFGVAERALGFVPESTPTTTSARQPATKGFTPIGQIEGVATTPTSVAKPAVGVTRAGTPTTVDQSANPSATPSRTAAITPSVRPSVSPTALPTQEPVTAGFNSDRHAAIYNAIKAQGVDTAFIEAVNMKFWTDPKSPPVSKTVSYACYK